MQFSSRRSDVLGLNGCVSSHQPLATQAGLQVLKDGGNAADAAIAMAGVLAVTEPFSNGLGGDCFCLYYDNATKKVRGLNGSGRSPSALTFEYVTEKGFNVTNPIPDNHGLSVMVPAAPAAYIDVLENFGSGKVDLGTLWKPAIEYAENGFPVPEITEYIWKKYEDVIKVSKNAKELLINNRAPKFGEIMKIPTLANTLKEIVSKGKKGFYEGKIAEAIVREIKSAGGVVDLADLANHESSLMEPIKTTYKNVTVWETSPNTTGITALMALNILEDCNVKGFGHNSVDYLHTLIEAIKLSFADVLAYVTDPRYMNIPTDALLSKKYAEERRKLINPKHARKTYTPGNPLPNDDTTYLSVVDKDGNACSLITSISNVFGSGRIPEGCGFALNNRGRFFSLLPNHPNIIAPGKRPLNTIIPAIITDNNTGNLLCSYGIMGGFMQPQAHVQVLLNMLEFGMTPQEALNAARLFVRPNVPGDEQSIEIGPIFVEDPISEEVIASLRERGHNISNATKGVERIMFGRGHVITKGSWWNNNSDLFCNDPRVLWTACDPRSDGTAIAF